MTELELRQETLQGWESLGLTNIEQEETAETIVPDACPDIWQVLDGEAKLLLQRKEAQEGRGEFSGLLKTTILYKPDGEETLEALEIALPFTAAPTIPGLTRQGRFHVRSRVLSVDVHLLNPRKILVRVSWCLEAAAFVPRTSALTSLVEEAETYGIRQKTSQLTDYEMICVQEKNFVYEDALVLPGGRPEVEKLLCTRVITSCTEARVIGTKLVFKGETTAELFYRGTDGSLGTEYFHLPWSQIMDAGENSEEGQCQVEVLLTDGKLTPDQEDHRSFHLVLNLQAQALIRQEVTQPILMDLYSTDYQLETETGAYTAWRRADQGEAQESGRAFWDNAAGEPVDVQVRLGRAAQIREGEDLLLSQEAEVVLLCRTAEGLMAFHQTVTVQHRLAEPGAGTCAFSAELLRTPSAASDSGSVEFSLTFRWLWLERLETAVITRVSLGERRESGAPSLLLRAVREGEDLWAVAKACHTTGEDILAASGLDSEELYLGQMLLIPQKSCG